MYCQRLGWDKHYYLQGGHLQGTQLLTLALPLPAATLSDGH